MALGRKPVGPPTFTATDLSWQSDGACQEYPVNTFFPAVESRGGPGSLPTPEAQKAIAICRSECLVRDECLEYALDRNEVGIWGATTTDQRKALRRKAQRRAIRERPPPEPPVTRGRLGTDGTTRRRAGAL